MASSQPPRPQIGIERLPPRRTASEPRELMNCKSCRKRKIKCNRLRPSCEACQVFGVPCIYDAVPKKRGPKTDVLEALLKRIDGLEKQLQPEDELPSASRRGEGSSRQVDTITGSSQTASRSGSTPTGSEDLPDFTSSVSPNLGTGLTDAQNQEGWTLAVELDHVIDHLISTYFARMDGKPFYLLDESSLRASFRESGTSPHHLAICAMAARLSNLFGDREQAILASNHYAIRARQTLDIDEPQLNNLMALLLLSQHAYQSGQGKKAYMCLSIAISMAFALNLHRELPTHATLSVQERDVRRMVFWTCYLLDRFYSCGSKRPCLIPDDCIVLRLPSVIDMNGLSIESSFFMGASNAQYMGGLKSSQNTTGILVEVVKILGITNRYLAAGGPKNDSHFPWHALSMLSKIRQELDVWAAETTEIFASLDIIFSHKDNTVLLLSKLIYHLIHCLIYRPFLPVDLVELSGTSQHQSWRIEATKLCFLHANTITELVEIWKAKTPATDLPAFVGYCISTAGSIHVHGTFYRSGEGQVFSQSREFCSLELRQLTDMRYAFAGVQHQLDTLQSIYLAHNELARTFASNAGRVPPVVNYDDFFDRYQGQVFDGAFLTLSYITPSEETSATSGPNRQQSRRQLEPGGHPKRNRPFYQLSYEGIRPPSSTPSPSSGNGPNKRRGMSSNRQTSHADTRIAKRPRTTSSLGSPQTLGLYPPEVDPAPMSEDEIISDDFTLPPPPIYPSRPPTLHVPQSNDPMFGLSTHLGDPLNSSPNSQQQQQQPETYGNFQSPSTTRVVLSDTEQDQDPFLALLEQLAENEHSRGGLSELDFMLSSGG